MVADDLIARLADVRAARIFDTEASDGYSFGPVPTLIVQHISAAPSASIDGALYASTERWQVSAIGTKLHSVRIMAQAVIRSLHGYTSESIKRADYDSWPGTIAEGSGPTRTYHAPVDFSIYRQEN